jgi:NitT/TauT family transport system permease protein
MEEIKSMKVRIWLIAISLALLVGWEFSARQYSTLRLLVSSPSLIAAYMKENAGTLLLDTGTTLWEAFCGLSIAVSAALSLMILCFWKPFLSRFLLPVMITSQVIPVIVLAPFFVILLGSGVSSKIAMAAVISFFPVFINFSQGYKAIPRSIHELYLINNASLAYRIKKVYFPLSTPSIMAGLKISATLASIGAIVAEFTGSDNGLGRNLFLSAIRLEPELMMCSLVLSAIIGGLLYLFIGLIERRVGKWYL